MLHILLFYVDNDRKRFASSGRRRMLELFHCLMYRSGGVCRVSQIELDMDSLAFSTVYQKEFQNIKFGEYNDE